MKETSADILEFESLRAVMGRYVGSPFGREELERIAPTTDRIWLEETLEDTAEALAYVHRSAQPQVVARGAALPVRFGGLPDARVAAQKLRIEGAVLEGRELYDLLALLDRADEIRSALSSVEETFPRLSSKAARVGLYREVVTELEGRVLPDGSLADNASPTLHRLRREIERQKRHIQESLERFVRAHSDDGTLQEDYVTLRNDRFVVPVVAGQRRRVDGVVHSASGTGRTLFVEPLETIGLNNELVRLSDEELREVHRILREMTDRLRAEAGSITDSIAALGELDILFAKAHFASDFNASVPRLSPEEDRRLLLRQARHPLLEDVLRRQGKRAVPLSLELDERTTLLLISGPNTGGKTVSMKTVGLLALMAQAGLPVPAEDAQFPLFDQVLADLGDNQSIAESLSSFSAHMQRVKRIEAEATFESLVLLDELGRATDPEEGGALGVALLDQFRMIGATTIASTHLLPMKVFGATTTGVLNGSMGFNEETLEPTYHLRLGAPGKSAALDIAARLGLPPKVLEKARAAMSTSERDISQFLAELHTRIETAAAREQELAERLSQVNAREQQLERDYQRREAARVREVEQTMREQVARFEQSARRTIAEIEQTAEQRKAADAARRKVARTTREFQEEVRGGVLASGEQPPAANLPKLEEGARVRLRNVREIGRVRRLLGDDRLEVEVGLMRMQVVRGDVTEVLPPGDVPTKLPKNITLSTGPKWDVSYREVNLIGKRAEEAIDQLDKFLDDASLASVDRVRVIHGFGMGVLRRAVTEHLARHLHVDRHYPAPPAEGGNGATIVELKSA